MNRECLSAHGAPRVLTPHWVQLVRGSRGNKDGFKLHGIQMTPFLLGSVVIYATGFTTFRALNVLSDIDKSDDYLQACHGQVDILNLPG